MARRALVRMRSLSCAAESPSREVPANSCRHLTVYKKKVKLHVQQTNFFRINKQAISCLSFVIIVSSKPNMVSSKTIVFLPLLVILVVIPDYTTVNCSPVVTTAAPSACGEQPLSPSQARDKYVQEIMPKLVRIAGNATLVFNHSFLARLTVSSVVST